VPWPRVTLTRYVAFLDYERSYIRQERVREMGTPMPRAGGVPFTGSLRQIHVTDAQSPWAIPVSSDPSASSLPVMSCTPPESGGTAPRPSPAPDSQIPCTLMVWAPPHGFPKAARAHNATTTQASAGAAMSFAIDMKHKLTGILDAQHRVIKVRT